MIIMIKAFIQYALCYFLGIFPIQEDTSEWTIIQRRVDASLSFEQPWSSYSAGFGEVSGNFWLGLGAIHDLTAAQPMRLQIDVDPFNFPALSLFYEQFVVGDAASNYLLTIAGFSATSCDTLDSLKYHNGCMFSTYNVDNDQKESGVCAVIYKGGWWFNNCWHAHLNGIYEGDVASVSSSGMRMNGLSSSHSYATPIRSITMKIQPI